MLIQGTRPLCAYGSLGKNDLLLEKKIQEDTELVEA